MMTKEQEKHLQKIKDNFIERIDKKYRAGQKEHGGDLWMKKGIIDMAIEEVDDLVTYLHSLKAQLDSGKYYEFTKEDDEKKKEED